MRASCAVLSAVLLSIATSATAADYPAPKQGDWIARDFKFHIGETMPELKLHYTTIGEEAIEASLLLINSANDGRNPPETGITDAAMKRIKNGKLYLIPETRGHGTTGNAKFYVEQVRQLLQTAPQRTM